MTWIRRFLIVSTLLVAASPARAQIPVEHTFTVPASTEAVASITAACERCDWSVAGREAVVLRLRLDGSYSQHLVLTRGARAAAYRVMLGTLDAGLHRLAIERDDALSAKQAGAAVVTAIDIETHAPGTAEHEWLARAPILHTRPGGLERFSDVPLMMYVERDGAGYRYTTIFSHEDGGTPTDRLMATWGRATDIEFVYGFGNAATGSSKLKEEYQGADHAILPFHGRRYGRHPLLWVSTDNNMVSDDGPRGAVRLALAPQLVELAEVSRETVMDAHPWLYAVMAAELAREGRIDAHAPPGSGKVADPRRFAIVEACGDVQEATLAFDLAVEGSDGKTVWHSSDRGLPRFRIAREGCFRAAMPLPDGATIGNVKAVRARAYTRPPRQNEAALAPGTGRVTLKRVNRIFMLDESFRPVASGLAWRGSLELRGEAGAVVIPVERE
jgi:hypothetical protein